MKALTLRGFDDNMREALKAEATRSGKSLNATVISVLRRSFGLTEQKFHTTYHDLAHPAGTWNEDERLTFNKNISALSEIDKELWS
jgi:plasmid stability protein